MRGPGKPRWFASVIGISVIITGCGEQGQERTSHGESTSGTEAESAQVGDLVTRAASKFTTVTPLGSQSQIQPFYAAIPSKSLIRSGIADYNRDGMSDLLRVLPEGGNATFRLNLSGGAQFSPNTGATRQGGLDLAKMEFLHGDFDGNGATDVAKVFFCGASLNKACIDVHLNDGKGKFTMRRWANESGGMSADLRWFAGDFNGDKKDDVAKCWSESQGGARLLSCDAHLSEGNLFRFARFQTEQGWVDGEFQFFVGDFNGDGRTDFAKVFPQRVNGIDHTSIDVHVSTGSAFAMQRWATAQGHGPKGQKWMAGDIDGDGKVDLFKIWHGPRGELYADVHASTGNSFEMRRWIDGPRTLGPDSQLAPGDFDGDGKVDLAHVFDCLGKTCVDVFRSLGRAGTSRKTWESGRIKFSTGNTWLAGNFDRKDRASLLRWWPVAESLQAESLVRKYADFTFKVGSAGSGLGSISTDRNRVRWVPESQSSDAGIETAKSGRAGILVSGPEVIVDKVSKGRCGISPPAGGSNNPRYWLPDGPPRAYKDHQGRTRLIVPHFTTFPYVGDSLTNVAMECDLALQSNQNSDWAKYDDATWLWSPYRLPNGKVVSINHHEHHAFTHGVPECPSDAHSCWYPSLTMAVADDGIHFEFVPDRLVASASGDFAATSGKNQSPGHGDPTNILRNPVDKLYYLISGYAVAKKETDTEDPDYRHCVMRTSNPEDPSSWRLHHGDGFNQEARRAGEVCTNVLAGKGGSFMPGSLSYSKHLNRFIYLVFGGMKGSPDFMGGYFMFLSESDDLTKWSEAIHVLHGSTPWGPAAHSPGRALYSYPSLLDDLGTDSFDVLDTENFNLFFVRYYGSTLAEYREVVRIPVRLIADSGPIINQPAGFFRVGGGAMYANGLGRHCAIGSEQQLRACGWHHPFDALTPYPSTGNSSFDGLCSCGR